jgi:hypothetical protein
MLKPEQNDFFRRYRSWFSRTIKALLVLSIPAYVVAVVVNRELGFLAWLEVPLISATLLLIVSLLERWVSDATDGRPAMSFYSDHNEFYRETRARIAAARKRVYVTYMRRHGPNRLGDAARAHFSECLAWAERSSEHHFRRIMVPAENDDTREFMHQQHEAELSARTKDRNYRVRVIAWSLHDADGLSVGIIDDEYAFVSYSSDGDRLVAFSIQSRQLVKDFFEYYYEKLWTAAEPIGSYLATLRTSQP